LVHYWGLDGNSVDAITGLPSTDADVTYPVGKVGSGCASFNGTTSSIKATVAQPTGSAPFSVSFWFYKTSAATQVMFFRGAASGQARIEIFHLTDGGVYAGNGGLSPWIVPGVALNAWHHVVFTYATASVGALYVDNGAPATATMLLDLNPALLNLGQGISIYQLAGQIDEVGVWNRALTATEAAQLYNSGVGRKP
jgi:hypothetical protein